MKPETMAQCDPWSEVSAARLPSTALGVLAPLRHRDEIRIILDGDSAWVRWESPRPDVIQCLLAAPAVQFFVAKSGQWYPFQRRLPTSDRPPAAEGRAIAALLAPTPFEAIAPDELTIAPVSIGVVRDGTPRPATALRCPLAGIAAWADRATTSEIESTRAARSGNEVILFADRLPAIPGTVRFWGKDLLVPLGFRPKPDLPSSILREAIGAAETELVLLDGDGADRIPREAIRKLNRPAIRLALREGGVS